MRAAVWPDFLSGPLSENYCVVFGDVLKFNRRHLGMNATAVSRETGLDPTTISKAEKGKRKLSLHCLEVLTGFYGINMFDLMVQVAVVVGIADEPPHRDRRSRSGDRDDEVLWGLRCYSKALPVDDRGVDRTITH